MCVCVSEEGLSPEVCMYVRMCVCVIDTIEGA